MSNLIPSPPPAQDDNTPLFIAGAIAVVSGFVAMMMSGKLEVNITLSKKEEK